ncbi:hypothetical protein XENOCAPTIV_025966, partial [Xenoophorus captivus]
ESKSRQRSGGVDPRRHAAGGAHRTCQVKAVVSPRFYGLEGRSGHRASREEETSQTA